ncbi:proline utilization trans-activator [Microdochium nivale]|nr:proline utilization trans-activator [Microdochium nivale]
MDIAQGARVDRRRRRPALACVSCRKSKIRCDRQVPCSNCSRSSNKTCVFDQIRPRPSVPSAVESSRPPAPASWPTRSPLSPLPYPASRPSTHTAPSPASHEDASSSSVTDHSLATTSVSSLSADALQHRVAELERRLARAENSNRHRDWTSHVPSAKEPDQIVSLGSTTNMHSMPRAMMSKTRYFGTSHWANTALLYKAILNLFHHDAIKSIDSEAFILLNKCKTVSQHIKASRMPAVCTSTPSRDLPPRHVADQLVDNYLRISESVYRVLHVPSFRARYDQVWVAPDAVDPAFMVQLHLVMAIGSTVLDADFSMRNTAIRWVFEAQWWMVAPSFKKRLTMTDLQSMILLCLARECAGVDAELTWMSVGMLLRMGFQMGYHRDPSRLPPTDPLQAELRRRLWGTILELNVQTSLSTGTTVLLSLSDFDTEPPADMDDVDLDTTTSPATLVRDAGRCTDTTLALALRATLPIRIAICRFLNDIGAVNAYDRTMEFHENLASMLRTVSRRLADAEAASGRKLSLFQRQTFDCTVRRYFLAIHIPYQAMSLVEPAYAFSKTTIIDNALKISLAYCPPAVYQHAEPGGHAPAPTLEHDTDLSRLAAVASGTYRWLPSHTALLIGMDLQHQLQEEAAPFSSAPLRPDLLSAVRVILAWCLRRTRAGDMNCRGYVFLTAQWIMIEGLMAGKSSQEMFKVMITSATEVIRTVLGILEEQARQILPVAGNTSWDPVQMPVDRMVDIEEDRDGMGDFFLDFLGLEPISHNFDTSGTLPPSQSWV